MTDWYVNNVRDGDGWFEKCPTSQSISLTQSSKYCSNFPAISIGQSFQIDSGGNDWETYRYDAGGDMERVWPYSSGNYTMRHGPVATYDGESETHAFVTINWALANAVSGDTVYVKWSPEGYLLTNADQIAEIIEPGVGSLLNKPIIIEGYHTTEGDMSWGGAHYQSPLHAKVFGIDTTKKVTISGENAMASLLHLDASAFVIIRNFYFKDATGLVLELANTPANVFFEHCIFADSGSVLNGTCNGFGFYDCYIKGMDYGVSSYTINCGGTIGAKFVGNVLDIGNYTKYGFSSGSTASEGVRGLYYGNLITGGLYPALGRAGDILINNTIYDSLTCVRIGYQGQWTPLTLRNNIIVAKTAADKGILIAGTTAGAIDNDNNCFWSLDGTPITNPITNDVPGAGAGVIGPNSIEVDPMLTSDYRPRNPLVLRGGNADIYGNAGQIGAVLSEHKFVSNAVASNQGRMRIFR